jgi:hypothetical protein
MQSAEWMIARDRAVPGTPGGATTRQHPRRARVAETGGRIDAGVSDLELKVTVLRPMDSTQAAKQL